MISILILTKNEQQDLPGCLESVSWSDDIHVYDSYSEDRTIDIALQAGAHITQRKFDNWAAHQNWGLRNIPFKHPWVFYIDADERMTPELRDNIRAAVDNPMRSVAFRVQRRDFLYGTWLRHVQVSPYYIRLFRPEKISYDRLVNPVTLVDGPTDNISGYLEHYPFSKGISHWLDRHNSYSTLEAQQIIKNRNDKTPFSLFDVFFKKDFNERRYHQKELFYRLPARPALKFLLLYFIKGGLLDGRAGLTYCLLQSFYELMIVLKVREMESKA